MLRKTTKANSFTSCKNKWKGHNMSKVAEIYEKALDLLGFESVNYISARFGMKGLVEAMEEHEYETQMDIEMQKQSSVSLGRLGTFRRKRQETKSESISEEETRRIQRNKSEIRIQDNRNPN